MQDSVTNRRETPGTGKRLSPGVLFISTEKGRELDSPDRTGEAKRPAASAQAIISLGGQVFTVKAFPEIREQKGGGKRQKIEYLSAASRLRLLRLAASVDCQAAGGLPVFVTLTYPAVYPVDPATFKGHLEAWLKRLQRQYPRAAGIWRLEPQKRGAPHYHLLIFNHPYIDKDWVATSWYEVVGSGIALHLTAGTSTEAVASYNGVLRYAAKYLAKRAEGDAPLNWGRWWGRFNAAALPINVKATDITQPVFIALQRAQRRILVAAGKRLHNRKGDTTLTCFLNSVDAMRLVEYYLHEEKEKPGLQERLRLYKIAKSMYRGRSIEPLRAELPEQVKLDAESRQGRLTPQRSLQELTGAAPKKANPQNGPFLTVDTGENPT